MSPSEDRLVEQLLKYYAYHRNENNQYCHWVGIPMVFISYVIALSWVRVGMMIPILSWLFFFSLVGFYLTINRRMAGLFFLCFIPLVWYGVRVGEYRVWKSISYFLFFTVVGWTIQFVGHYRFEGKRPAFFDDIWQQLNAPLFVIAEIGMRLGYFKKLKRALKDYEKGNPLPATNRA